MLYEPTDCREANICDKFYVTTVRGKFGDRAKLLASKRSAAPYDVTAVSDSLGNYCRFNLQRNINMGKPVTHVYVSIHP